VGGRSAHEVDFGTTMSWRTRHRFKDGMPDPSSLRDSTQIVLPKRELDGIRSTIESEFTVSVFTTDDQYRIIGSPVEIKAVSKFLARHGVSIP